MVAVDEFDIEAAVWSIPAKKMKMRKPHNVPLPAPALALLDELRRDILHRGYE